jgi:hypothetical protein
VRFHAIARSLARLTADGDRQIFYLSNDPTDVERIEIAFREEGVGPVATHDLGLIRRGAASVGSPDALRAPSLPRIPAPNGARFEDYAVQLGVSELEPSTGAAAQHLAYLLWDDLETLRELLQAQIESVGQWQQLSDSHSKLAKSIEGARPVGAQLDARAALLDSFCRAWQQGRGRGVDRGAIEQSDAIRDTFLDAVVEIAAEQAGDAERLVEILRARGDDRLRGFRSAQADALREYLTLHGYIDEAPILAMADIVAHAMATPAANQLPRETAGECIRRWWKLATQFRD